MTSASELLNTYPIISDQVNREDINVVLGQLNKALDAQVPGDVVEFGCYIGTTSLFIRRLLDARQEDRAFHAYDSFEGLPPKGREDDSPAGTGFRAGALAVGKKQFIREFQKAGLKLPVTHKGWFDQLTEADVPTQIAFAFLDGDFYQSIKCSLQLVLPHMSQGGVIVLHDFAREALPGVAKAARECGLTPTPYRDLGIVRV